MTSYFLVRLEDTVAACFLFVFLVEFYLYPANEYKILIPRGWKRDLFIAFWQARCIENLIWLTVTKLVKGALQCGNDIESAGNLAL